MWKMCVLEKFSFFSCLNSCLSALFLPLCTPRFTFSCQSDRQSSLLYSSTRGFAVAFALTTLPLPCVFPAVPTTVRPFFLPLSLCFQWTDFHLWASFLTEISRTMWNRRLLHLHPAQPIIPPQVPHMQQGIAGTSWPPTTPCITPCTISWSPSTNTRRQLHPHGHDFPC